MSPTEPVKRNPANYESDNPGTKANLARILVQGKLGGTGSSKSIRVRIDLFLGCYCERSAAILPGRALPDSDCRVAVPLAMT